jgi:hypothetical protein
VVNNVVFPCLDVILAILLFVKIGSAYLDYRKHGQIEWTPVAIIFGCLIFQVVPVDFRSESGNGAQHQHSSGKNE